jgi:hypothetical protein
MVVDPVLQVPDAVHRAKPHALRRVPRVAYLDAAETERRSITVDRGGASVDHLENPEILGGMVFCKLAHDGLDGPVLDEVTPLVRI